MSGECWTRWRTAQARQMPCLSITIVLAMGAPMRLAAEPSRGQDRAPEVWFAPNDDLPRPQAPGGFLNHDFPQLFDPNPAWDANMDVFKISPKMGSTIGPADQLTRITSRSGSKPIGAPPASRSTRSCTT
jgi:hypothetical protein